MNRDKQSNWDFRFMELARLVASWSKDPSTKVGASISDKDHRVLSVGFNGYARGVNDSNYEDRIRKYAMVIHAEENALLLARGPVVGGTMYVWPLPPCPRCAAKIIQAGITRVVTVMESKTNRAKGTNVETLRTWEDGFQLSKEQFLEAGVEVVLMFPLDEFEPSCASLSDPMRP